MSYHLPGFRDANDEYFPKVIYFTATWKEVKDYKQKYEEERSESAAAEEATKHLNDQDAPAGTNSLGYVETPGANVGAGGASDAMLAGVMAQLESLKLIIQETQRANAAAGCKN